MTHPFHPWHGREFLLIGVRQNWSEDRVFFLGNWSGPGKWCVTFRGEAASLAVS